MHTHSGVYKQVLTIEDMHRIIRQLIHRIAGIESAKPSRPYAAYYDRRRLRDILRRHARECPHAAMENC